LPGANQVRVFINVMWMPSSLRGLNKFGLGMCIRDDEGHFVLAKMEWIYLFPDVDLQEAPSLLFALRWVRDLQLAKVVLRWTRRW